MSDLSDLYLSKTVNDLKKELRRRKLNLTGNKNTLIRRLEANDKQSVETKQNPTIPSGVKLSFDLFVDLQNSQVNDIHYGKETQISKEYRILTGKLDYGEDYDEKADNEKAIKITDEERKREILVSIELIKSMNMSRLIKNWMLEIYNIYLSNLDFFIPIDIYTSDDGLAAIGRYREGKATAADIKLFNDIDSIIEQLPPLPLSLVGYRGVMDKPIGDMIKRDLVPYSASLVIQPPLSGYIGENMCCVYEIEIPIGSKVAFHISELQLIFPGFSTIKLINKPVPIKYEYPLDIDINERELTEVVTYPAIYEGLEQ